MTKWHTFADTPARASNPFCRTSTGLCGRIALVCIGCWLLCGCGNGDGNTGGISAEIENQPTASSPAAPTSAAPTFPELSKKPAPAVARDPLAEVSENEFEIVERPANYVVVKQAPRPPKPRPLAMTVPHRGTDSSSFVVVSRPSPSIPMTQATLTLELPDGFDPVADLGVDEEGYPLRIRCRADDSLMALVPAGMSVIGTNHGPDDAKPRKTVYLDAFYMDITEVTVRQFLQYLDQADRVTQATVQKVESLSRPLDYPAVGLTYVEVTDYLQWSGKMLPTEAEWEKAARGPQGFDTPWGNGRAVWAKRRTYRQLDPVKSFRTDLSPYGIYDLAGNAREWCIDWYTENSHSEIPSWSPGEDVPRDAKNWYGPRRSRGRSAKVVKGNGPDWRSWYREGFTLSTRESNLGFRGVLRFHKLPQ